jgi:hypothetical protein
MNKRRFPKGLLAARRRYRDRRGRKLGDLPRLENTALAQMPDRGEQLRARIAQLRVSQDLGEPVKVAVELAL